MASIGNRLRFEVLRRDGFACRYCGATGADVILEVDHVQARAEGGSDDIENLITACRGCNRGKGKLLFEPSVSPIVTDPTLPPHGLARNQLNWPAQPCNCETPTDPCSCSMMARAINAWLSGSNAPRMSPTQRSACLKEIEAVFWEKLQQCQSLNDAQLAQAVYRAWRSMNEKST